MKKLEILKGTLPENQLLSVTSSAQVKGGASSATEDEKRRQRPGGGISTN